MARFNPLPSPGAPAGVFAAGVCPPITPNEQLEIAWATAKYYFAKIQAGGGKMASSNTIANSAYKAAYPSAPYPIPENFEQIANCQGWANAWLRIRAHLKGMSLPTVPPSAPSSPSVVSHLVGARRKPKAKGRYSKVASLFG